MKKKDLQSLKTKSIEELIKMVSEKRVESETAKLKAISGQEKNLKARKNLRIEIARILTLVREKRIAQEVNPKKEEIK